MDISDREDNPIDSLRASIEKDYRFKTSFTGFDKSEVKKYLTDLEQNYGDMIAALEERAEELRSENAELASKNAELESAAAGVRMEERRRLEAEMLMQEGVAANLRQANAKLTEENRCKDIEIADLKKRIDLILSCASGGGDDITTLCISLKSALEKKLTECGELIAAWKGESGRVIDGVRNQIRAENAKQAVICPGNDSGEDVA